MYLRHTVVHILVVKKDGWAHQCVIDMTGQVADFNSKNYGAYFYQKF